MGMNAEGLSTLLLGLYRISMGVSAQEFRNAAVDSLRLHLPFDGLIWTTNLVQREKLLAYDWLHRGTPDWLIDCLKRGAGEEALGALAAASPGRTLVFRAEDIPRASVTEVMTACSGMAHVMITAMRDERLQSHTVMALGRRPDGSPFSEDERAFMELLMPHLDSMIVRNFETQLLKARGLNLSNSIAVAIATDDGGLLMVEPNFHALMALEWPDWNGGHQLPPAVGLLRWAEAPAFTGQEVSLYVARRDGHMLLVITKRSAVDALTRAEYLIAAEFSLGKSHKEVARVFGLSPETVRGRLRAVYDKLGISDKGQLACHLEVRRYVDMLRSGL